MKKISITNAKLWIIAGAIFLITIIFFDSNSILVRIEVINRIKDLEKQKEYYKANITEDSTILEQLKNNLFLEQFAREHYMMSSPGETVYIIKE